MITKKKIKKSGQMNWQKKKSVKSNHNYYYPCRYKNIAIYKRIRRIKRHKAQPTNRFIIGKYFCWTPYGNQFVKKITCYRNIEVPIYYNNYNWQFFFTRTPQGEFAFKILIYCNDCRRLTSPADWLWICIAFREPCCGWCTRR